MFSTAADDARWFVSFFSFVGFTSMSSARVFSPTIIPSYTSTPAPMNSSPRSTFRLLADYPRRDFAPLLEALVRSVAERSTFRSLTL